MAIEEMEPASCTLWQFHERFGEDLNRGACKELIGSIRRHGQRHPVLGRRLAPASGAAVELIYGARRLFAATELGIKRLVHELKCQLASALESAVNRGTSARDSYADRTIQPSSHQAAVGSA